MSTELIVKPKNVRKIDFVGGITNPAFKHAETVSKTFVYILRRDPL